MTDASTPNRPTTDDVLAAVDLSGRVAVVTGATTGLGLETARALANAGAHVVLTGRTAEKAEAAVETVRDQVAGADVEPAVMELGSLASVRVFAAEFATSHDRLDLLIENAGIMSVPFGRTEDGFELQFGTNHLGHFLLVAELLALLVEGAPSRVVVLSSAGHGVSAVDLDDPNYERREYAKLEAYGQSKSANVLFAAELDRRYSSVGVHAYSVHPGMVATDLGRYFTRDDYAELMARAESAGTSLPDRVDVGVGAATSVWAATAPELDDHGGAYLADVAVAEPARHAQDPDIAAALWSLSEDLVGREYPNPAALSGSGG